MPRIRPSPRRSPLRRCAAASKTRCCSPRRSIVPKPIVRNWNSQSSRTSGRASAAARPTAARPARADVCDGIGRPGELRRLRPVGRVARQRDGRGKEDRRNDGKRAKFDFCRF